MDDDGDDKDDCKRRTRNLSEKKRRDQFNSLLNELGTMVSQNNKKMDKSTVLKSTISFLNKHNEITVRSRTHDVREDWKPTFLSNEEFNYLVLEALEGFVMVFTAAGRIYYVSESVTSILGHNASDIMNRSIFDLTYEDDRSNLYGMLQNLSNVLHPMQTICSEDDAMFQCHLQRGNLDCQEEQLYELIQFHGHFRTNMDPKDNQSLQDHDSRLLFVCTGRLCKPMVIRDVSLVDVNRNEFTSRHSLEWKFLFLDHRAPPIIGFLPFEVLGTSVYDYYHFDDLEKIVTCHESLMQKGELTSCYYRFLTKGQQWIWLQTRFYITYHQWNSKPEFIVCTNRVISYADVTKKAKKETVEMDPLNESNVISSVVKLVPHNTDNVAGGSSPSGASETSVALGNSSQSVISQAPSVESTTTSVGSTIATVATSSSAPTSWHADASHVHYPTSSSESASVSGESKTSRHTQESQRSVAEPSLLPQHGIGAQYLDPIPYVGTVGPPAVLPLPLSTVPVIVYPDQTQIQLQRTHRELQELIACQQEELRQVKEQLLLARLGFLPPMRNIQDGYTNSGEMHHNQQQRLSTQMLYEGAPPRSSGYQQQQHSSHQHSTHQHSSHQHSTHQHAQHRHHQHHHNSGERQNHKMKQNHHHRHHHNMPPQ